MKIDGKGEELTSTEKAGDISRATVWSRLRRTWAGIEKGPKYEICTHTEIN